MAVGLIGRPRGPPKDTRSFRLSKEASAFLDKLNTDKSAYVTRLVEEQSRMKEGESEFVKDIRAQIQTAQNERRELEEKIMYFEVKYKVVTQLVIDKVAELKNLLEGDSEKEKKQVTGELGKLNDRHE